MKYKKSILSVGTIVAASAPIAAVVACGSDYGDNYKYYGDIQVITDAGSVADKSFNESAFQAAQDYAQVVDTSTTFGYSQPKTTSTLMLQKAYESALKEGSRTLLLPGFTHSSADAGDVIEFAKRMHSKYPTAKYVNPDGFTPNGAADAKNGYYALGFDSNESGFMAAIYGGLYFNKVKHVTQPIKAWTFGGGFIAYGVTSYMDGFLAGAKYFNDHNNSMQDIEMMFYKGSKPSLDDFTGSFDAGAATAKVQSMVDRGAQLILPVAGPQTGDVTGIIAATKNAGNVFAFGVDTDQSLVYNPDYILGSAVKGIYAASSFAIDALKKNPNHDPFGNFNYNMTNDSSNEAKNYFAQLKSDLKARYIKEGMTEADAEFKASVKTMPTGFVPSSSYRGIGATTIEKDSIYTDALTNVASLSSNLGRDWSAGGVFNENPATRFGYDTNYLKLVVEKG